MAGVRPFAIRHRTKTTLNTTMSTSLSEVPNGLTVTVEELTCPALATERLKALGLLSGCQVRVRQNDGKRALVVEFRGTFLGLSRKLADAIAVDL